MSDVKEELHDARTHREPKWPVGGFAPGNYQIRCYRCKNIVSAADKRSIHCFPCAVDGLQENAGAVHSTCVRLERENETLRNAIRIVQEPPHDR